MRKSSPLKKAPALAMLAGVLLFFAGAGAVASEGSVLRYGRGDEIIVLESGSRERLGTLCVTGCEVLLDADVRQPRENDDGTTEYDIVTYRVVQIYYTHTGLELSPDPGVNFRVWDGSGIAPFAEDVSPKLNYKPIEKKGQSSIIVALCSQYERLFVTFYYPRRAVLPTARIRLDIDKPAPKGKERYTTARAAEPAPPGETDALMLQQENRSLRGEVESMAAGLSGAQEEIRLLEARADGLEAALGQSQARGATARAAFALLGCADLACVVLVRRRAKKAKKEEQRKTGAMS